jgi:hypothetical protein
MFCTIYIHCGHRLSTTGTLTLPNVTQQRPIFHKRTTGFETIRGTTCGTISRSPDNFYLGSSRPRHSTV